LGLLVGLGSTTVQADDAPAVPAAADAPPPPPPPPPPPAPTAEQRRAPTAGADADDAADASDDVPLDDVSTGEIIGIPTTPADICPVCEPQPQRRAPTLDRCDVATGYFEDRCDPCPERPHPWWRPVEGDVRFEYRFRSSGSFTDQTAWQFLNLNFGPTDVPGWSAAIHGAVIENLDPSGSSGFDPLFNIWDTYGFGATVQLYHAYATYRPKRGAVRMARFGRMWIDAGEMMQLDGGLVDLWPTGSRRTRDFSVKGYAGVPSYLFDQGPSGEFAGGIEASSKLWRNARGRLQWTYIKNSGGVYGAIDNHLTTLTIDQCFRQTTNLQLRYQMIDEDPRYLTARFNTYNPRGDWHVTAWVNTLLKTQVQQVYDTDLYYAVLRETEPYIEGYVTASKGIGECFNIEGLFAIRRLYDQADNRAFNREFERYALTLSTFGWPNSRWSASISGEYWNDTDEYGAGTIDIEYKPSKRFRLRAGTDYALYSRDVFTLEERLDSYGYFARARYDFTQCLQAWMKVRVEVDSYDTYTLIRTGLTWEL